MRAMGVTRARNWGRWVHLRSLGSLVHPVGLAGRRVCAAPSWGRWVRPASLGSLACALGVGGSSGVFGLTRARHRGYWVHSVSLGSLERVMGVVGFIWVAAPPGGCLVHPSLVEPRLLTGREGLVQRNTSSCSLCSVQCKPIRFQETRGVT